MGDPRQVQAGGVVKGQAKTNADLPVDHLLAVPLLLEALHQVENLILRGFENALQAAKHRHGQDVIPVILGLDDGPQELICGIPNGGLVQLRCAHPGMPPWARKRNVSTVNGALRKFCETRSHRSAAIRAMPPDTGQAHSNTMPSAPGETHRRARGQQLARRTDSAAAGVPGPTDKATATQKDLPQAEARRRSGAPEGGPILALDGSNDGLESTADSANKNVKQGRDKLEHDVLLTSGRCRTRGLIGAP